jgi:uncharacterized membrane protein
MSLKIKTVVCQVCGQTKKLKEALPADAVRLSLVELIKEKVPNWDHDGFICKDDLDKIRAKHVEQIFDKEKWELSDVEKRIIENIKDQEIITQNLYEQSTKELTFWEGISDKIAKFGGSWKFIAFFFSFMAIWMISNVILSFFGKAWDNYPYILLNLMLSCVAAIQAPIIMMSQNRIESRDRMRSESEYQINLKAEIGIRNLNEKMDHILFKQWEKMSEIQQIQLELMREIGQKNKVSKLRNPGASSKEEDKS